MCQKALFAGANDTEKIREDVCKVASLKTSSDETVCQKALLAGAKLKSEECSSETVCQEALLERCGNEKSLECGSEAVCQKALLERCGDEKSVECGSETVCQEELLEQRNDNGKKIAVFGNGSIRFLNDYEWYDSDNGDIGVELGECEQGGVLETDLKFGARNSYTIEKGSSDVIGI